MLLRKFWGLGFGSEIVRSLLVHAGSLGFRTFPLEYIPPIPVRVSCC
jgi:hypothetical protein